MAPWSRFLASVLVSLFVVSCWVTLQQPHAVKYVEARFAIQQTFEEIQPIGSNIRVRVPRRSVNETEERERRAYQQWLIDDMATLRPNHTENEYEGRMISPAFFTYWQELQANNVDLGERIYLGFHIWDCIYKCEEKPVNHKSRMERYLHTLDPRWKYFLVLGMDKGLAMWGMHTYPQELDILVFQAGGTTRGARNIQIPLLGNTVVQPKGLNKTVTVGAAISIGTHATRARVKELWDSWGEIDGYQWKEGLHGSGFLEFVEQSNFTLTPRGHGTSSFRMFTALQLHSIPIYIWTYDRNLPYEEIIDWEDIAIVLHLKQIGELQDKIKNFDVGKAQRILSSLDRYWTFEGVFEYIVRRLQTEVLMPIPRAAYMDVLGYE